MMWRWGRLRRHRFTLNVYGGEMVDRLLEELGATYTDVREILDPHASHEGQMEARQRLMERMSAGEAAPRADWAFTADYPSPTRASDPESIDSEVD